jgi:hypothetical protein
VARYRVAQYVNRSVEMIEPVIAELISFEAGLINKRLEALIRENVALGGTQGAFFHDGVFFSLTPRSNFKGIEVRHIAERLEPAANSIVTRRKDLDVTVLTLRQTLAVVARACSSLQDLRDVLPDSLVADLPSLSKLERFRQEGEVLADRPTIFQQYQRAVDTILQLKGKRLIHG